MSGEKFIVYLTGQQSYIVTNHVGDVFPVNDRVFWDDPHDLAVAAGLGGDQ